MTQSSIDPFENTSPDLELPKSHIEFKLIRETINGIEWEVLPFNGNHHINLSDHSIVQIKIQEGSDTTIVISEIKQTEKKRTMTFRHRGKSIETDEADKFAEEILATWDEDLIIASLHLPVNLVRGSDGKWETQLNNRTMYPSLYNIIKSKCKGARWIGYYEIPKDATEDDLNEIDLAFRKNGCIPVYLENELITKFFMYYEQTLYPFFHNFISPTDNFQFMATEYWEAYNEVNKKFAGAITEQINPDTLIWLNDMHLLMCPLQIVRKNVYANIGLYIHSSFPSGEIYKLFPYRQEILQSMLCCNIIGFHAFPYARNFIVACRRLFGITHQIKYYFAIANYIETASCTLKLEIEKL